MENVPDVLNYGGHNVAEEVCETLNSYGYASGYTLLNAAHFGVPQMRERMILFAFAKELGVPVDFPHSTHRLQLPRGYQNSRDVALRTLRLARSRQIAFTDNSYFVSQQSGDLVLKSAVTAREAIGDLPPIKEHLNGRMPRGVRRFVESVPYPDGAKLSPFARLMREWPGFSANPAGLFDHVIRSLPRDYPIFRRMNPGDQYPEAHKLALRLFEEKLAELAKRGIRHDPGSARFRQLQASIVPPYDPGKFPNKWRKIEADGPARTLMAHIGKDTYSHIHYDSLQARTISVREAARLQSFPDGFIFEGAMNAAFRQIGNAVPPLLAYHLARHLLRGIGIAPRSLVPCDG
jgi:DNA (cytosine-5)-methyltransferase 1